jgi:hypothetical protein
MDKSTDKRQRVTSQGIVFFYFNIAKVHCKFYRGLILKTKTKA